MFTVLEKKTNQTQDKGVVVSKQTAVLHQWGIETIVWFINRVDN